MQTEYNVQDFSDYLSRSLDIDKIETDGELEGFDLETDYGLISIGQGILPGSVVIDMKICDLSKPLTDDQILELASASFVGNGTGGGGFYLKDKTIGIKITSSPDSSLEEMFKVLDNVISASQFWQDKLKQL